MPLIPPPDEYEEYKEPVRTPTGRRPDSWYRWFFDVPNWKCAVCGAVMQGRVKMCVYCKQRLHKDTPRPADFDEGPPYQGDK